MFGKCCSLSSCLTKVFLFLPSQSKLCFNVVLVVRHTANTTQPSILSSRQLRQGEISNCY